MKNVLLSILFLFVISALAQAPTFQSDIIQAANMAPCSTSHFSTDSIDTIKDNYGNKLSASNPAKALYLSAEIDSDFIYANPINSPAGIWVLFKTWGGSWVPVETRRLKLSTLTKHPDKWFAVLK